MMLSAMLAFGEARSQSLENPLRRFSGGLEWRMPYLGAWETSAVRVVMDLPSSQTLVPSLPSASSVQRHQKVYIECLVSRWSQWKHLWNV